MKMATNMHADLLGFGNNAYYSGQTTTYTVGDTDGWSSGTDYTTWVSRKSFKVGDKLVFTYLPNHDVLEVSKANYETCTSSSPISSDNSGSTTISLTAVGKRYFICGKIGHCLQGMLLEVDTSAASSSSPPPPATTSPPPSSLETPPPSSPTTPPPPTTATPPSSTSKTPPVAGNPPPSDSKVAPPPPLSSSGHKIGYGVFYESALMILAAI
ncbi:unnamed protein product [Rhodiola kirilowii]